MIRKIELTNHFLLFLIKMENMNLSQTEGVQITIKIDNMIRNYCCNFLSYLYVAAGWKRVIFDTSKENYIDSEVKGKKIRILIANNGTIILTCFSFTDILHVGEYLLSQFQYGRMGYYLVADDNVSIKISGDFLNEEAQVFKSQAREVEEISKRDITVEEKLKRESLKESFKKENERRSSSEESDEIVDDENRDNREDESEDTMQNIFSFLNNIKFADYF